MLWRWYFTGQGLQLEIFGILEQLRVRDWHHPHLKM